MKIGTPFFFYGDSGIDQHFARVKQRERKRGTARGFFGSAYGALPPRTELGG